MDEKQEVVRSETTAMEAGPRGLEVRTLDELWRISTAFYKSGLMPKGIDSPEKIFVAVQAGLELGLPLFASVQNFAIINGRPSIYGTAAMGVVRASGKIAKWVEGVTESAATVTAKRINGDSQTSQWTIDDAKRAGLWGKQGPWSQYPKQMLLWRARNEILRGLFADVMRGMVTVEESRDIEATTVEVETMPEPKPRKKAKPTKKATPPPLPDEPGADDIEVEEQEMAGGLTPEEMELIGRVESLCEQNKVDIKHVTKWGHQEGYLEHRNYVAVDELPVSLLKTITRAEAGFLLAMKKEAAA